MTVFRSFVVFLVVGIAAGAAVDPSLLNLVMPDAKVIGGIDVDQAKASPFGQFVLSQIREDEGFRKFVLATGFDPRRDLREIIVASNNAGDSGHGIVIARGFFDKSRIADMARLDGASVTTYKGVDILAGKQSKQGAAAFLDNSTVVVGDPGSVRSVIDRRGSAGGLDPKWAAKAADVSRRNDVWFVSKAKVSELASKVPDPRMGGAMKGEALQGIEEASGGIKFGPNILISLEAVTRSEKDATALADVVRFLAGMVQLNRDKQGAERIASLVDTMDLKTDANVVKLSLSVPQDQFEKLLKPPAAAPGHKAVLD